MIRKRLIARTRHGDYRVNFLVLAMQGKKVGFDKVLSMIDAMVTLLGKEQVDDDKKKAYCEAEFDKADDEIKDLTGTVGDIGAAIEEAKETTSATQEEVNVISNRG